MKTKSQLNLEVTEEQIRLDCELNVSALQLSMILSKSDQ
jgi:hypothetical protein